MDRAIDASSMLIGGQFDPTNERELAEVDTLLKKGHVTLRFPPRLETMFRNDMALHRIPHYTQNGYFGIAIYNSFIVIDWFILPDIIALVIFVQLVLISPILALGLLLIKKRIIEPEIVVTINLILLMGSIILFYMQSHEPLAGLVIFTVPVLLASGNLVLPLPFRYSAWFTGSCLAASSVAALTRSNQDPALAWFAIMTNASAGIFMLIATFRMEAGERHAYLVNLREKMRAEILDANNMVLRGLSETDALTGLANRRAFDDWCGRLWTAARDRSEPMSMLLVDIDHFKRLNDTHGHLAGDDALRCIAQCLKRHAAPGSIVARYGGEEFAILVAGGNLAYVLACAEVLREAVERLHDTPDGTALPTGITVSIGLAIARPSAGASCMDMIAAADQALYKAKAAGRNRVVVVSEHAPTPADAAEIAA